MSRGSFSDERRTNDPEDDGSAAQPDGVPTANPPEGEGSAEPVVEPRCTSSATLRDSVSVSSQAEANALAACEVIEGGLSITAPRDDSGALLPLDLRPLAGLHTVGEVLELSVLRSLEGLEGLRSVGALWLTNIDASVAPLGNLSGELEDLIVNGVPSLQSLQVFEGLVITERLQLDTLRDLESLAGPQMMAVPLDAEFPARGASVSIGELPRLASLSTLQIAGEPNACLRSLSLSGMSQLARLGLPSDLTCVNAVTILDGGPDSLEELAALAGLQSLRLSQARVGSFGDTPFATDRLRSLDVDGAPNLPSLSAFAGSPQLEEVSVRRSDALVELDVLATLPALQRLTVANNASLQSLPVFELLDGTRTSFSLRGNPSLEVPPEFPLLEGLRAMSAPASLEVLGNPNLTSIGSFPALREVDGLTLSSTESISVLWLPALELAPTISIHFNEALTRVDLPSLRGSTSLSARNNPALSQVGVDPERVQLESLELSGNPALSSAAIDTLLGALSPSGTATIDGTPSP